MPGDSTSTSTSNDNQGLADALAREQSVQPDEASLLRAVGDFQDAQASEDPDFSADRDGQPRRGKSRREDAAERETARQARDAEDEDDEEDDDTPRRGKGKASRDARDDADDEDDEDDDNVEDDDGDEDDAEDEDDEAPEALSDFARRFGLKPKDTKAAATSLADDFTATIAQGFNPANQQNPPPGRQAAGSDGSAPSRDGSAPGLIDAKMLEEIEEWNPQAAAAFKALGAQVEQLHTAFRGEQAARIQTEINRTIDRFTRKMGLEKVYGQGRQTSDKQRDAKAMVVQTAAAFQAVKRSMGVMVSDEDAVEAALVAANRGRILGASKREARREVRESLQRRQRRLDMVPSAGSVSRASGAGRGDPNERSALQLVGQWQQQNRRRTA